MAQLTLMGQNIRLNHDLTVTGSGGMKQALDKAETDE